jgi:SRR1
VPDAAARSAGHPARRCQHIRCYGLGRPSRSLPARAQLALLPLLRQAFAPDSAVTVHDPALEEADVALIEGLGFSASAADAAQQHAVAEATLFYMPHCDAALYNDVLDANWSAHGLARLAFLGNSFETMQVRCPALMCFAMASFI